MTFMRQSINIVILFTLHIFFRHDQPVQTVESGPTIAYSIERFRDDPAAVKFYTGFQSYDHFIYVFQCLGPAAHRLKYQSRKLSVHDEFFLFLIKIRLDREDEDLSYLFSISIKTAAKIFSVWLHFLYHQFQEMDLFVDRAIIDEYMPRGFKAKYPKTR